MSELLNQILKKGNDILYIVPPFSLQNYPSLGIEILRKITDNEGISSDIFYGNIHFSNIIGSKKYQFILEKMSSLYYLGGERIFTNVAYENIPKLGYNNEIIDGTNLADLCNENHISYDDILNLPKMAKEWTINLARKISECDYKIIAISINHQQTNAAISIVNYIKSFKKDIICILGGSSCDGIMAKGIMSLSKNIDYVFSGESEDNWLNHINKLLNNEKINYKIIKQSFPADLNKSPCPNYDEYFRQLKLNHIKNKNIYVSYETSRGCWWGNKSNKCIFCGVNGTKDKYRHKTEEKIINDLDKIITKPIKIKINMTDTLMPRKFIHTLIPKLTKKYENNIDLFYEQRADLSLDELMALKNCGVNFTQVGIESLSTALLKQMNKGISAEQNISFLRHAKICRMLIGWNLLYGIPNETTDDWENILKIVPLIHHLNPPIKLRKLEIARFSPLFNNPEMYNINNLCPNDVYKQVFPKESDIDNLAWLFDAEISSDVLKNNKIFEDITESIYLWKNKWKKISLIPRLEIQQENNILYLNDTRFDINNKAIQISNEQADISLNGPKPNSSSKSIAWALKHKTIIKHEGNVIPLATAETEVLRKFYY